MNDTDYITMLGNISRSLGSVNKLLTGMSYLTGILFIMTALVKYKKLGQDSNSHEGRYVATVYFISGAILLFLPSMLSTASNSFFGTGNVLQYASYQPNNIYNAMLRIIQTAGLLWFIRGCTLLVSSGQSGAKLGPKGLTFIAAGIFAMNFQSSVGAVTYIISSAFHIQIS